MQEAVVRRIVTGPCPVETRTRVVPHTLVLAVVDVRVRIADAAPQTHAGRKVPAVICADSKRRHRVNAKKPAYFGHTVR